MPPTPDALAQALREAWSRDTSDDPENWSPENPALGQCAVSALVARAVLGGTLVIGTVLDAAGERTPDGHAWVVLPDGQAFDPSFDQFRAGEAIDVPFETEPILEGDAWRAHRVAERVGRRLGIEIALPDPPA